MTESTLESQDETETIVNYMPGMPSLSTDPGRIERAIATLLRRRGPLRPVVSERTDGE